MHTVFLCSDFWFVACLTLNGAGIDIFNSHDSGLFFATANKTVFSVTVFIMVQIYVSISVKFLLNLYF